MNSTPSDNRLKGHSPFAESPIATHLPCHCHDDKELCSYERSDVERMAWIVETVESYEGPLIEYACRMLQGDVHRARDCVQETFLRLVHEDRGRIQEHIGAWLYKCCRHKVIDALRKESCMGSQFSVDQLNRIEADETDDPANMAIAGEEQRQLKKEIEALSPREKEVLALRLQQGMSYKQIAHIMDLSVSNVGLIIHQAVHRLRESLPSIQQKSL